MSCMHGGQRLATKEEQIQRFWEAIQVDAETGCWLWTAGKTRGYGQMHWGINKKVLAHRISMELHLGYPIPVEIQVNHARFCFHRNCVNPEHLYLGNQQQNMEDKIAVQNGFRSKDWEKNMRSFQSNLRRKGVYTKQEERIPDTNTILIEPLISGFTKSQIEEMQFKRNTGHKVRNIATQFKCSINLIYRLTKP